MGSNTDHWCSWEISNLLNKQAVSKTILLVSVLVMSVHFSIVYLIHIILPDITHVFLCSFRLGWEKNIFYFGLYNSVHLASHFISYLYQLRADSIKNSLKPASTIWVQMRPWAVSKPCTGEFPKPHTTYAVPKEDSRTLSCNVSYLEVLCTFILIINKLGSP